MKRQNGIANNKSIKKFDLFDNTNDEVIKDELIVIDKKDEFLQLRRIAFWEVEKEKVLEFINNYLELTPDKVAEI